MERPRRIEPPLRQARISIRDIRRADATRLAALYAGLSVESRRRRFLASGTGLTPRAIDRLCAGDGFVAVLDGSGRDAGSIVGHADVVPLGAIRAEIAIAVADAYQGRRIGSRLITAALARARGRGCRTLTATLFPDNVAMRRLIGHAGCPIVADTIDAGVEEVTVALAA